MTNGWKYCQQMNDRYFPFSLLLEEFFIFEKKKTELTKKL